jgi:hypothetical protein
MTEPLGVVDDVDLDDFPASDRERHDREQIPLEHADRPGSAVDEDREPEKAEVREGQRSASDFLGTAELDPSAWTGVASEDHVWVEDSDEALEVTVARSREKCVDNASLNFQVRIRSSVARLNAPTRAAGASVSSTTSSARPTLSASSAACSGLGPSARSMMGSGT